MHDNCMKEQIKEWLKSTQRDRTWLAEQIGVKPRTVDNWLSSPQVIPGGKLKLIERLMEDDAAAEAQRRQQLQPTAQVFSVEVDLPTFRAYSAAALASGQILEAWAIAELNAAAEAALSTPESHPKQPAPSPVTTGATPAKDAGSPPNITHMPPLHIAAETPGEYKTGKLSS